MKVFFKEIRAGNLGAVRSRLDANPALIGATATAPPKKDDGQSPLQVAIKSGQFEIAHELLDRGADVNFMETSELNRWNTPVLHDAIRATVFSTRFGTNWALPGEPARIEIRNTEEGFNRALGILNRLLGLGADPNALDSAGNPALMRAILDARQITVSDLPLPHLIDDLRRVFDALLHAGADPDWFDPRHQQPLRAQVEGTRLRQFVP